MGNRLDSPGSPAPDAAIGEVLPPEATVPAEAAPEEEARAENALAIVRGLARTQHLPAELLAVLDGKLADAVAVAADYASDAISEGDPGRVCGRLDRIRRLVPHAARRPNGAADPPGAGRGLPRRAGRKDRPQRAAAPGRRDRLSPSPARPRLVGAAPRDPGDPERHRAHPRQAGRPAAALTAVEIRQLIASCAEDLPGLRDRALFLVGFAGALRRSELVAIDHAHLRFAADCVVIHIPRSKGDQEGKGADVTLPRMRGADTGAVSETCPVRALERWLQRARITRGPVFRGITTHGTIEGRLSADGVRKILLRRAALAKLMVHPSERLSPHGLRAGLITEAYLAGAPDEQVMQHTRHADLSTMRGYRRRARVTADNPARLLDL